jgi:penicillin-binding protein 2
LLEARRARPCGPATSLSESCDVYYYDMAPSVGIDKITAMARRASGSACATTCRCRRWPRADPDKAWKLREQRAAADWLIGDTLNASIGQGFVLASPLQLAVMTARLATGHATSNPGW